MKALALFLLFITSLSLAKAQVVSGIIIDDHNNVVPNVLIKDSTNRIVAVSDLSGRFELSLPQSLTLSFSCKGYQTLYLMSDELSDTILLQSKERFTQTITVNAAKINPVMDEKNCNVLDYVLIDDYIFILYAINL